MTTYVVDDDPLSSYLTVQLMQLAGYTEAVDTFPSGKEALEAILQNQPLAPPELIFLDLNMPVMNGWEFLEALAPYEEQLQGRCHIFILTSSLALSDMNQAKQYRLVEGVIHKPIDLDEIRAIRAQLS